MERSSSAGSTKAIRIRNDERGESLSSSYMIVHFIGSCAPAPGPEAFLPIRTRRTSELAANRPRNVATALFEDVPSRLKRDENLKIFAAVSRCSRPHEPGEQLDQVTSRRFLQQLIQNGVYFFIAPKAAESLITHRVEPVLPHGRHGGKSVRDSDHCI